MQQITPNVYIETKYSGCNPGFVMTSKGIVMIDTPFLPTDSVDWRKKILDRGVVRYIINTEYHMDHMSGNTFFPGIVVSHQGVKDMLLGPLEPNLNPVMMKTARVLNIETLRDFVVYRHQELDPEGSALTKDYQFKLPTITFSERLTISLGAHDFQLIHLPGHTPFEVAVYIPQEKVLFTGDNVTHGIQPSLAQCCPLEWVESLKQLLDLDINHVVPGHGEVGDKNAINQMTVFIEECVNTVQTAIKNGTSKEEAANTISFEHLLLAHHPGSEQQKYNVRRLYDMLS